MQNNYKISGPGTSTSPAKKVVSWESLMAPVRMVAPPLPSPKLDRPLSTRSGASAMVCLSSRKWDSMSARSRHLIERIAQARPVFFVVEPGVENDRETPAVQRSEGGVWVLSPRLSGCETEEIARASIQSTIDSVFADSGVRCYSVWQHSPMARFFKHQEGFTSAHTGASRTVPKGMRSESARIQGASAFETDADLSESSEFVFAGARVFTGGASALAHLHPEKTQLPA